MLPYASYLRVYEPLGAVAANIHQWLSADQAKLADTGVTLAAEQQTSLTRAVVSPTLAIDAQQLPGAYVLRREGRAYLCPVDMPLRSWLSLSSLVDSIGDVNVGLLFAPETIATADEAFLRWRQDHPSAVPHIRQATWGVPRTWFTMVAEDERETYVERGRTSVRFRAQIADARRRIAAAHHVLLQVIDETDLLDELTDLARWLDAFDDSSYLELDYAGVAALLKDDLHDDESARDVHQALTSLRKGDLGAAGSAYQRFEKRWRAVNAYERAN